MNKKLQSIIALVLLFMAFGCLQAQTKETSIIEGSRVLLEFTKLFVGKDKDKSKRADLPCDQKQCADAFFENKDTVLIKVMLLWKETGETKAELVVPPNKKESVLELKAGLYTYEFYDQTTNMLVRKSDIRFTACENIYMVIQ